MYRAIAAHAAFEKCPTVGHFSSQRLCTCSPQNRARRRQGRRRFGLPNKGSTSIATWQRRSWRSSFPRPRPTASEAHVYLAWKSGASRLPSITTGIKQLEHQPEVGKPVDEDVARTRGTGAAIEGISPRQLAIRRSAPMIRRPAPLTRDSKPVLPDCRRWLQPWKKWAFTTSTGKSWIEFGLPWRGLLDRKKRARSRSNAGSNIT